MSSLGSTLKESRKNLGLTLRRVEELSGISNAYLSQLENNKIKNPSANILSRLSSLYKVSLKTLLDSSSNVNKKVSQNKEKDSGLAQKIAFSSEELTDEEKKEVLRYLEYIKTHRKL